MNDRMQKERAWGQERETRETRMLLPYSVLALFYACRESSHTSQTATSFIPKKF